MTLSVLPKISARSSRIARGLTALVLFLASISVHADPRISNLQLELEEDKTLLTFELQDAFDDQLLQRIESGLPSGFAFDIALVKMRRSWFDKTLASGRLQVVAMYNAVTREYLINKKYNGELIDSMVVEDLSELKTSLTSVSRFGAFSLAEIPSAQRLIVQVRAELATKTIFFFIPKTVSTEWQSSRRFSIAADPDIE